MNPICTECKWHKSSATWLDRLLFSKLIHIWSKCSNPKLNENAVKRAKDTENLFTAMTGKTIKESISLYYCSTARSLDSMCVLKGKLFEPKEKKRILRKCF